MRPPEPKALADTWQTLRAEYPSHFALSAKDVQARRRRGPKQMNACHAASSDDLTIILPRSDVYPIRDGSSRLISASCGSRPRSQAPAWERELQHEKTRYSVRKPRRVGWRTAGTMAVPGLILAIALTAATRSPTRQTARGEERIAALVGQPTLPEEPLTSSAVQYPITQSCSARTTHGTTVNFLSTPTEAAAAARKNNKLTFLLHISGNFEDPGFT